MGGFDWDRNNIEHLAAHGVTPSEFEQALILDPEYLGFEVVDGEERFTAVGPSNTGRLLFLVWTMKGEQVRAITAFTAGVQSRKEWEGKR